MIGAALMLLFARLYYWVGKQEYRRGILLAEISVILWILTDFCLGLGWMGAFVVQVLLYVALTIVNMVRGPNFK